MEIVIPGIQIENKIKGIRIKIEPDEDMQYKWRIFYESSRLRSTQFSDLPVGIFLELPDNPEEGVLFFNKKEQTPNFVLSVVLWNKQLLMLKNRKFTRLLLNLVVNRHCMFSKVILFNDKEGDLLLKTIFLAGDETTGLLNNL
jgi:hypothetical protein